MRETNKERVAEALGISVVGLDEFLARQKGLLIKMKKISAENLLYSYSFLIEIKEREEEEKKMKQASAFKNVLFLKYAQKIEDLYMAGWGAIKIEKYLYEKHRVKLSKSTIERGIRDMGFKRSKQ